MPVDACFIPCAANLWIPVGNGMVIKWDIPDRVEDHSLIVANEFIVSEFHVLHFVSNTQTSGSGSSANDSQIARLRMPLVWYAIWNVVFIRWPGTHLSMKRTFAKHDWNMVGSRVDASSISVAIQGERRSQHSTTRPHPCLLALALLCRVQGHELL